MNSQQHKCFISFKTQDLKYKKHIQEKLNVDMIDKSLNVAIDSDDEEYIMKKIRTDYLADSTVTICLIGMYSAENAKGQNQSFIKRELQASLYNGKGNTRNGILGVVLPEMTNHIYKGTNKCNECGGTHNLVIINDDTIIKEFSYNYYIPHDTKKCCWNEDERYCVLVKWEEFCKEPEKYINQAFDKRSSEIANKVRVYPK